MKNSWAIKLLVPVLAIGFTECNQRTAGQAESATAEATTGQTEQPNQTTNKAGNTGCQPLETRQPNSPEQKPTFEGQTRACAISTETPFDVVVLATGLQKPWAVEPLEDGSFLITEKSGNLRFVSANGTVGAPISGVPKVDDDGQGGLLDVALSPNFKTDRTIFWSFTEPRKGGNGTSVARGVLSADRKRLEQVRVIFQAMPTFAGKLHYGSRLAFGPDGMLYVTTGERSVLEIRPQAQFFDSHMGKVLRITPEGKPAPENPYVNKAGAKPEIWTLGHRNIQSAAFDGEGRLWVVEMGPQGGDELNLIKKGLNYGWPLVTFGEEYSGRPVPNSVTHKEGFADPVYYWDPVIAPSGAQFYSGDAFPEWKGNLFVGALRDQRLVRLKINGERVVGEEHLLTDRSQRIRDVKQGADGFLYLITDESDAELLKIMPRK